jgi:F-type H+-transporting ATPase subunit gamma
MPSLKEVRNRITSVNSTQQITKAMKMVAAAKLRRAQEATMQLRPYASKMMEMLATVSAHAEVAQSNPYKIARDVNKVLVIVITSDRGLCGAFNTNVAKATVALLDEKYATQKAAGNVVIMPIGKKGGEFFQRRGYTVVDTHTNAFQNLSFATVKAAAEEAMAGFVDTKWDAVEIVYNQFKNVATQIISAEQMLPILPKKASSQAKASNIDYIFEPSEEQIINDLIPKSLKLQVYKAVLESNASEHGARMTAMDKATDNAGELLKELKLIYNRSRQAAITKEILEIVGGAEALAAS